MGVVRFLEDVRVDVGNEQWTFATGDAGNPHAIVFDAFTEADIARVGPVVATHARFPQGTNVEFARLRGPAAIDLVVWERGVGLTLACGTGACATVAVAVAKGLVRRGTEVTVTLPGGPLHITLDARGPRDHAWAGPARLLRCCSGMSGARLTVLVVVEDAATRRAIEHVVDDAGDTIVVAGTVEEAVGLSTAQRLDVAFVELRVEGGAAIALCHHLPGVIPGIKLVAIVHPAEIDRGPEALSLGATSVLVAPPTGEALAHALGAVKAENVRRREVGVLEQKLARERKRLETYDRLVRFARGAAPSDAVRAIVDGVSQLSAAQGVALYATFGDDESDRILLGASGTAQDLPRSCPPADLSRLVQARGARVVPLVASPGELGMLVLDRAPQTPEPEIAQLADLAAAMLSIVDRPDVDESMRIFPPKQFRAVADRLLTLAQRHDRRASVLAISIPGDKPNRREDATREIADIVRTTDALSGVEEGDLVLLLPETSALGAHACRRRILARLSGDRRARATDDARSSVHALALDGLALGELVDTLLSRPLLDAGPRSSYPLDLACSALFTLAARACQEAQRGGESQVTTTLQPGLGLAAAARQVGAPRVHDVRGEPGCDNVEAIVIEAEHGTWVCCGRIKGDRFQGVHAADPLLADILERRIVAAGSVHAG